MKCKPMTAPERMAGREDEMIKPEVNHRVQGWIGCGGKTRTAKDPSSIIQERLTKPSPRVN